MSNLKPPNHNDGKVPPNWTGTDEEWEELRELWDGPSTKAEIASQIGVNKFALNRWRSGGYLPHRQAGPRTDNALQHEGDRPLKYTTKKKQKKSEKILVEMSVRDFEKPRKKKRDELYAEAISKQVEYTHSIPNIKSLIKIPKFSAEIGKEDQVALFSDTHPGVRTRSFNCQVFIQRLEVYTRKIIELGKLHSHKRPIKTLHIFMLGDLVNGEKVGRNVNSDEFECSVDSQIFDVFAPAVCKMLLTFANHYENVHVYVVYGNHGSPAGKESAYSTNWDVISMRHVAALLQDAPNITFKVESRSHYQIVNVRGHYFLLQHGDHIPSYLATPIYGITNRALKMHAVESMKQALVEKIIDGVKNEGLTSQKALRMLTSAPFSYFILGHFHTIVNFEVGNLEIITNGTFKSDDQYVLKRMGLGTSPKQVTFGVSEDRGMTWFYKVHLDG